MNFSDFRELARQAAEHNSWAEEQMATLMETNSVPGSIDEADHFEWLVALEEAIATELELGEDFHFFSKGKDLEQCGLSELFDLVPPSLCHVEKKFTFESDKVVPL